MSKILKNAFLLMALGFTASQATVLANPWDDLSFPSDFSITKRQFSGGLLITKIPQPERYDLLTRLMDPCPIRFTVTGNRSDCIPVERYFSDKPSLGIWINHTPLINLLLLTGKVYSEPKNPLYSLKPTVPNIQITTQCALEQQNSISLYRSDLRQRLARNWRAEKRADAPTILITVDREGRLLKSELYEQTGNGELEKAALYAATVTEYSPLPDWCEDLEMTFKINMRTLEPSN